MPPARDVLMRFLALAALLVGALGCSPDPADAVIGTWVVDLEHSSLPAVPPALQQMAEGATKEYTLRLDRDGTFSIKLWRALEGTWKLESDTVFLTAKEGKGTGLLGEIEFKVLRDLQRLETGMNSPLGRATLQFKRGLEPVQVP